MQSIAVIVPIYNIESYLPACLDSIVAQTYGETEIILVDDGSSDRSGEICDAYAKKDARIRVIHKENGGLVSARKAGLAAAVSDIVCCADGDDWMEPDMLEKMMRIRDASHAECVLCGNYEETGDVRVRSLHGIPAGFYEKEALQRDVLPRMMINGAFFTRGLNPSMWGKLFLREKLLPLQTNVNDSLTMGEDAACVFPYFLQAESIAVTQDCLYHYRQSVSSMSRTQEDDVFLPERFRTLYQNGKELLEFSGRDFDCQEQWRDYVLFLMIPRLDVLYPGIEHLDFLFPFPQIKKGDAVFLYGAGAYGKRLYRFLKRSEFCEVRGIADKNHTVLSEPDLHVSAPKDIPQDGNEPVLITVTYAKTQQAILEDLKKFCPSRRIYVPDTDLLRSADTKRTLGLL